MPSEKSTPPKIPSGRKSWSCLPSCFVGSLTDRPGRSAGPKPGISWFSWSRYQKKKKTVPLEGARPNIKASAQKSSPSSEGRTARSRSNAQQPQRDAVSDRHAGVDPQRPRLPRISAQYNTGSGAAPTSLIPDPVRTGSSTSRPSSPAHVHPPTSHKSPVRTGRLEPTAGLWVMVVTLAVMVLLGRVSAVICLCSCLYLVTLFGVGKDDGSGSNGVASREDEMNSVEYKKRVILEGLLERNGRKPTGFLVAPAQAGGTR